MILADLCDRRRARKVLMQAPKNGFFYVLDRAHWQSASRRRISSLSELGAVDRLSNRSTDDQSPKLCIVPRRRFVFPHTGRCAQLASDGVQSADTGSSTSPRARTGDGAMRSDSAYRWMRGASNMASSARFFPMPNGAPAPVAGEPERVNAEQLIAWDPLARRARWRVSARQRDLRGRWCARDGGRHRLRGE